MKVIFYFTYPESSGGVFVYAFSTLNALIKNDNINKIFVIVSAENRIILSKMISHKKIHFIILRFNFFQKGFLSLSSLLYDICDLKPKRTEFLWKVACFINPFNRFVDSLKADLLHIPSLVSMGYGMKTPVLVTMHDFQELYYPEFFSPFQRLTRALLYKRAIENSNHIIVSFPHIKEDVIKYFDVDPDKISVCFNSNVELWFKRLDTITLPDLKVKYKLPDIFVFYPAKTWPHKNYTGLLKALYILNQKNIVVNLVITSTKTDYYKHIESMAKEMGLYDQIWHLGLIPQEELAGLYRIANATVIPTLYEAGSGPLFEAMYFNCPIICSNVTSLPDTIGDRNFTFNPNNYDEIADKIEKVLFNEEYRKLNKENSKKRIALFSKSDYSNDYIVAYERATQ